MHSHYSDGVLTPKELARMVFKAGLKAFALTDHDSLAGLEEAEIKAAELGLEFVPGVEISALFKEREVHILGYYPQKSTLLESFLLKLRQERFKRLEKMVTALQGAGFKIAVAEILKVAGPAAPGRMHLARVLIEKGYVYNAGQAFSLYLGRGKSAFVPRVLPGASAAIAVLLKSGAVPVLAHPGNQGLNDPALLKGFGLQGVEVYHPDHLKKQSAYYKKQAEELNLVITGGSDYHADGERTLKSFKNYAISYSYLLPLKEAARKLAEDSGR